MGFYRCFLAILVVFSHADITIGGYNPGVVAVISFFLLSGYVMTVLVNKHYPSLDRLGGFYTDRGARLFPQFVFYALVTLVLMKFGDISSPFLTNCSLGKISLNLLMLPLDFYWLINIGDCMLLPQAWSLGLELCFYIVIPFILIMFNPRTMLFVFFASAAVFMLAFLGVINTDYFGYRILPGTLFMFLVGSALAAPDKMDHRLPWAAWIGAAILFALIYAQRSLLMLPYNKEVLLGLLIGIPAVTLLRKFRFSALDETFGNLSYGIFLNHFFCLWLLKGLFHVEVNRTWHYLLLLALSALLALISYYAVEKPALNWRRNLRYRSDLLNLARSVSREI
jgi:peptidoglycan/LPS O-acetylase OafA/YrhL